MGYRLARLGAYPSSCGLGCAFLDVVEIESSNRPHELVSFNIEDKPRVAGGGRVAHISQSITEPGWPRSRLWDLG
jgi:hypothetical protein